MGYGYAETFLVVFLSHPGVVIPTMATAAALLPPEAAAYAPAEGFPPVLSGLWQTMWAWILSIPGEKSAGLAWAMYVMYLIFLFLYMYLILRARFTARL